MEEPCCLVFVLFRYCICDGIWPSGVSWIGIWPCLSLAIVWVIVHCLDLSGCEPAEWCVLFSFDHFIYVGMECRKRFQVSWHKCQSEKVLWSLQVLQVVLG